MSQKPSQKIWSLQACLNLSLVHTKGVKEEHDFLFNINWCFSKAINKPLCNGFFHFRRDISQKYFFTLMFHNDLHPRMWSFHISSGTCGVLLGVVLLPFHISRGTCGVVLGVVLLPFEDSQLDFQMFFFNWKLSWFKS